MDCVAEVLDVLGSHNSCDGTNRWHMVSVPASALVGHGFWRHVSRQCCSKLPESRTKSQVGHSLIDRWEVRRAACAHLDEQNEASLTLFDCPCST